MDNQETPSIIEAIETTAADMRRAYLASLQPEWPPGRLAGPLGELEIRFCIPPSPAEPPAGGCDWGYCDNEATVWRWTDDNGWLPVCAACETKTGPGQPPGPETAARQLPLLMPHADAASRRTGSVYY